MEWSGGADFADYVDMSLSALTLTSVLPAAAGAASSVASTTVKAGSRFLGMLADSAKSLTEGSSSETDASSASDVLATSAAEGAAGEEGLDSKMQAWCNKLAGWLKSRGIQGDYQLKLRIDELDRPQGEAENLDGDIAWDELNSDASGGSELLRQFRDLVLESSRRISGLAPGVGGNPSTNSTGDSKSVAPQDLWLDVQSSNGQVVGKWTSSSSVG